MLPVKIHQTRVAALIDSGSVFNCISPNTVKLLNLPIKQMCTDQVKYGRGAGGEFLYMEGYVEVPIKVEGCLFYTPMRVMTKLTDRMILGMPFLRQYDAKVDFVNGYLSLMENTINTKLVQQYSTAASGLVARITQDYVMPPKSHNIIPVTVPGWTSGTKPDQCTIVTEPFKQTGKFFVAHTVVRATKNMLPCQILNNSNRHVRVRKGTPVARIQVINDTDISDWTDPSTDTVTPRPVTTSCSDTTTAKGFVSQSTQTDNCLPDVAVKTRPVTGRKRTMQELGIQLHNENLTTEQRQDITKLLEEYSDIFAVDVEDLKSVVTPYYHSIHLKEDTQPIYTKQYRYPEATKKEIASQIEAWKKADIIEPSLSMFNNPLVLVPKKEDPNNPGKKNYRLCADLRKLNLAIKEISYPLPTFNEIMDSFSSKEINYISTCDFKQGFLQIPIEEKSRDYLSCEFQYEKFRFKKLPFGLTSSSHVFMNIISDILGSKILGHYAQCYVDDLLVFSDTWERHKQHLTAIFDKLRVSGLMMNPAKCNFAVEKCLFLGFYISKKGIEVDPEKIKIISDYKPCTDVAMLRSFLGYCSFYRRFIKSYAQIVSPLNKLLCKDAKFVWSKDANDAFLTIKKAMTQTPVLALPNLNREFNLYTDASYSGIGYSLTQVGTDGLEHAIHFGGRGLSRCEKN